MPPHQDGCFGKDMEQEENSFIADRSVNWYHTEHLLALSTETEAQTLWLRNSILSVCLTNACIYTENHI